MWRSLWLSFDGFINTSVKWVRGQEGEDCPATKPTTISGELSGLWEYRRGVLLWNPLQPLPPILSKQLANNYPCCRNSTAYRAQDKHTQRHPVLSWILTGKKYTKQRWIKLAAEAQLGFRGWCRFTVPFMASGPLGIMDVQWLTGSCLLLSHTVTVSTHSLWLLATYIIPYQFRVVPGEKSRMRLGSKPWLTSQRREVNAGWRTILWLCDASG